VRNKGWGSCLECNNELGVGASVQIQPVIKFSRVNLGGLSRLARSTSGKKKGQKPEEEDSGGIRAKQQIQACEKAS